MAYTDADILNIYKGYTYGIASSETKIQGMSSADKARLAKLAETDWYAEKSTASANAIINLLDDNVPFSASLIRDVNSFDSNAGNNQANKTYSTTDLTITDSSPLSITTDLSKYSTGLDIATSNDPSGIIVNPSILSGGFNSSTSSILNPLSMSSDSTSQTSITPQPKTDRRVRISPKAAVFDQLITSNGIMAPLRETYGMMFPITPTINETIETNYDNFDITHGLMPIQAYRSGGAKILTVSGVFVAQTDVEARYCAACIHFIRSFSKMNFGDSDPNAGTPPPIMMFNAYGDTAFRNIPVILTQATLDWPNDVDYVYTSSNSGGTSSAAFKSNASSTNTSSRTINTALADGWVPSKFTISVTLTVQYTPSQLRSFNLADFRNGSLMGKDRGWI